MRQIAMDIAFALLPVFSWLERRRPPDKALVLNRKVNLVLTDAVRCASLDIPEYTGGTVVHPSSDPSPGLLVCVKLLVTPCILVAGFLADWANEIDAEVKPPPPTGEPSVRDEPEIDKRFAGLWKIGQELRLKKNGLKIVGSICRNAGRVKLADLAVLCEWQPKANREKTGVWNSAWDPAWNSAAAYLNRKLMPRGWRLNRHDNHAVAQRCQATSGRKSVRK